MKTIAKAWKTILVWSLGLVAVLMVGALIDASAISGTCVFILIPYFAAIMATAPLITVKHFGAGMWVYVPYVLIGFFPLYYFDWLQSKALIGLWAVLAWSVSGLLIGACLDLANLLLGRFSQRTRAIAVGATMQAATFVVMLVGLKYLYVPTSAMAGHLGFFDRAWFFTLPWMVLNGACGGYIAHALTKRV